jgi:hypothetical protein
MATLALALDARLRGLMFPNEGRTSFEIKSFEIVSTLVRYRKIVGGRKRIEIFCRLVPGDVLAPTFQTVRKFQNGKELKTGRAG